MNRTDTSNMYRLMALTGMGVLLAACTAPVQQRDRVASAIRAELEPTLPQKTRPDAPTAAHQLRQDQAVKDALLPPLTPVLPRAQVRQLEPRFDLVVTRAPADTVLMSIVSGTRYNMVVHPRLAELAVTLALRDVTVTEALDVLRDQYDLDWRQEGSRIFVEPQRLQTRVFRVNYIAGRRSGSSDLRVTSGSISGSGNGGSPTSPTSPVSPSGAPGSNGAGSSSSDSSTVSTRTENDFWPELANMLDAIVGKKDGRSVTVSAQTGMIVVQAMPSEMRVIERYLREMQLAVNRQVILEAKIIEVSLSETYQTGINWGGVKQLGGGEGRNVLGFGAAPATGANTYSGGYSYNPEGVGGVLGSLVGAGGAGTTSSTTSPLPAFTNLGNGGFAFALARTNFSALIQMLEGQGKVNVLSSPRIATLNNQKAVLKVGTDDFYVTNISVTQTTGTTTTSTPSVTLRPFFSGIALDVTPQIDDLDNVILHVHPSVSQVTEKIKSINAGIGTPLLLPLASSNVSETDSIIRVADGQVVVIGGLMSQEYNDVNNRLPGADGVAGQTLFGSLNRTSSKRELVILMKATIVTSEGDWARDIAASRDRSDRMLQPTAAEQQQPAR